MHSIFVVLTLVLLARNLTAMPCGGGGAGSYDVGIVTCPEQAVVLIQLGDSSEGVADTYPIAAGNLDSSDHDLNGGVVESAANEAASANRDPLVAIEAEADLRIAQDENPNLDSSIVSAASGATDEDDNLSQDAVTPSSANRDPLVAIEAEADLRIAQNENPKLDSSIVSAASGATAEDANLNQDAVTPSANEEPTQNTNFIRDPLIAIEEAEKAKLAAVRSESSIPQQNPHEDADEYVVENTPTSRCFTQ